MEEELTVAAIMALLEEADISFGVDQDAIEKLVAEPVYDEPVIVAQGEPPVAGEDAQIEYMFDASRKKTPTEDEHGRVDYKDLNYIQNASKGEVLVQRIPPTAGTPGKTVFGIEIAALKGKDKRLIKGPNTQLSVDGLTLTSVIDGTIVFKQNSVGVQAAGNISGSIDSSTGNINCAGSLKIAKGITSDFKVKVGGDLEIGGNVEDAIIEAECSVLIRGGFFGGGHGSITAGGDVTVKYVENQKIRAEGSINVGGQVLNADIYASEEVIVEGKMGSIVGGTVAAKHLVRTVSAGNDAGVLTHLHVGYDMKLIECRAKIEKELARLEEDEAKVKKALVTLYKLELTGKLPPDKQTAMDKLKKFNIELPAQVEKLQQELKELDLQLKELFGARIVIEKNVHSGTVIHFGPVYKEILDDIAGGCVFENVSGTIIWSPFQADKEGAIAEERRKKQKETQSAAATPA